MEALATGRVDFVVEGDSWFNHPFVRDVLDWFNEDRYVFAGSFMWGRQLHEMVRAKRYLQPLRDYAARAVLLSGGGNDLIWWKRTKQRPSAIFRNGSPSTNPEDYVVMPEVEAAMAEIARLLRTFVKDVRGVQANVRIVTHFYDRIEPRRYPWPRGEWVDPQLDAVGVPRQQPLRNGIAALLLDTANAHQAKTCADLGVTFASMLGTVKGRWFDEIHPTGAAFRAVATKLAKAALPAARRRRAPTIRKGHR